MNEELYAISRKCKAGLTTGNICDAFRRLEEISMNKNRSTMVSPQRTSQTCVDYDSMSCKKLESILFIYVYPWLWCLCIYGNVLNILVYRGNFLRSSSTIQMLAAKAIANAAFVTFLFPNTLIAFFKGTEWEAHYWYIWLYSIAFSNIFGACATWLTVSMAIESFLQVAFPHACKTACSMRNVTFVIVLTVVCAFLLNLSVPIVRVVLKNYCADTNSTHYFIGNRDHVWAKFLEKVYLVLHSSMVITLPIILLASLSLGIAYELTCKRRQIAHLTIQKRCVMRLTAATTACHIAFETPALFLFLTAVMSAEGAAHLPGGCTSVVIFNFLSILNASIPFLIYIACTEKFRQLFMQRHGCHFKGSRLQEILRIAYSDTNFAISFSSGAMAQSGARTDSHSDSQERISLNAPLQKHPHCHIEVYDSCIDKANGENVSLV